MKYLFFSLFFVVTNTSYSQSPVGTWKVISHICEYAGEKFDSHQALLTLRPCAADITYIIHSDGKYRLDASQSNCDERFKKIQEKLYSESVWTVVGNTITIGHKKAPLVGQKYLFTISGNKMIWTGTDGQGIITYQKN